MDEDEIKNSIKLFEEQVISIISSRISELFGENNFSRYTESIFPTQRRMQTGFPHNVG
jgi:hypothetical protein